MSYWTYVTGVIEVDTCARSDAEAMYLAQTVVNHLPRITGSERNAEFHYVHYAGKNSDHCSWQSSGSNLQSNTARNHKNAGKTLVKTLGTRVSCSGEVRYGRDIYI